MVRQAVAEFGGQIAVGIDARDGMVAAEGWVETSAVSDVELAKRMEDAGVQCLICTDIARDGMLSGPNLGQLTRIQRAVKCDIVASRRRDKSQRYCRPAGLRAVRRDLRTLDL